MRSKVAFTSFEVSCVAVVEEDACADLEGVGEAVGRDGPALGDIGLSLG
jgi:hypothetical protein